MIFQQSKTATIDAIRSVLSEKGLPAFFTAREIEQYARPAAIRSLCVRYLAKTMILDVIGNDFLYTDISITNSPEGAPVLKYENILIGERLRELEVKNIFISFSHTKKMAGVFMIFA